MKLLDLTLDSPAENLACDEALLDLCAEEGEEILRFWESRQHFVVVGYGNRIETEVNVEECHRRGVPILRRCSGGGTVVQGPGCLNYSVMLRTRENGPLTSVTGTNEFVMERNRAAMEQLLGIAVSVQGHTDLAFEAGRAALSAPRTESTPLARRGEDTAPYRCWLKFSGNAQRRRRNALIFHGTILHNFDLELIDALLRFPSAQPEYRVSRSHAEFVRNVPARVDAIRCSLRAAWQAREIFAAPPSNRINQLRREHYENDAWTLRRVH